MGASHVTDPFLRGYGFRSVTFVVFFEKAKSSTSVDLRLFCAFDAIVLNALEVRAHSDPPPVSPRASRDMSGTPEPPRGERGSPPGGSPETITPTALFANVTNGAAPSSSASGPSERTSSTKKLGLVKDQLEMVERRARDGTTRNEVRHPSRACLVRTDGASPRLLPRARKRVASDADSKRRAMTRRRPRSVPRGADDVETTRARGSRRDDARPTRWHVARLAVAPLAPLRGSARREDPRDRRRRTPHRGKPFRRQYSSQSGFLARLSRASTTVSRFRRRRARYSYSRNPYSRVTLVVYARTVDTAAFSRHDNTPRLFRRTRRAR